MGGCVQQIGNQFNNGDAKMGLKKGVVRDGRACPTKEGTGPALDGQVMKVGFKKKN